MNLYSKPVDKPSRLNFSSEKQPTTEFPLLRKEVRRKSSNENEQKRKKKLKDNFSNQLCLLESERLPLQTDESWCLVVDDNPFNLMVASHIMSERGYQVKTAMNGQDAVEKASEDQRNGIFYKLVLMDCQMPVMDGYEATRILKNMMDAGEMRCCPVIALTANNRSEQHERLCKNAGMDGHVSKPLQVSELESVLKDVACL